MSGGVAVVLVLLGFLGFASAYMGVFRRVNIEEREVGPLTLVYQEVPGTGTKRVLQVTRELGAVLEARGVAHRVPLDVSPPDGRASEIGLSLEDPATRSSAPAESGALLREIPRQRSLVAEFPWRNPLSLVVGYAKVEPALARYRARHGYVKTEALALNDGNTIRYVQPVREANVTSSHDARDALSSPPVTFLVRETYYIWLVRCRRGARLSSFELCDRIFGLQAGAAGGWAMAWTKAKSSPPPAVPQTVQPAVSILI